MPALLLQAVAGLLADARSLADVAKEEASSFRSNYGYDIPLKVSVAGGGAARPHARAATALPD